MQHIWLIYLAAEHLLSSLYTGSFPSHLLRIFKKINNYKLLFFHWYCRKWLLFTCKHESKVEAKHNVTCTSSLTESQDTYCTKAGMWGWEQQPAKRKITAALSDSARVMPGWTLQPGANKLFMGSSSPSFVSHSHIGSL